MVIGSLSSSSWTILDVMNVATPAAKDGAACKNGQQCEHEHKASRMRGGGAGKVRPSLVRLGKELITAPGLPPRHARMLPLLRCVFISTLITPILTICRQFRVLRGPLLHCIPFLVFNQFNSRAAANALQISSVRSLFLPNLPWTVLITT
jgi:hypothetical protein